MKNLFVPYELAVKLKEKGFDEYCLAEFINGGVFTVHGSIDDDEDVPDTDMEFSTYKNSLANYNEMYNPIAAPLYQQVVDWFKEKHQLHISTYLCGMDFICYKVQGFGVKNADFVNSYGEKNDTTGMFTSNYEALNKAIEAALKLI